MHVPINTVMHKNYINFLLLPQYSADSLSASDCGYIMQHLNKFIRWDFKGYIIIVNVLYIIIIVNPREGHLRPETLCLLPKARVGGHGYSSPLVCLFVCL